MSTESTLRLGARVPSAVEVDTLSLAVPAQRFLVTAEVVRGRQAPVVQDFALRLLRVVGSMDVEDLRSFFGWNGRELSELLGDLMRAELVIETEGRLSLGPAGTMAFAGAEDLTGPPVAVRSELVKETVGFDKVSFNITGSFSREPHVASLPVLQIADRARAAFSTKAIPDAFRRNWREWSEGRFNIQGHEPDPELQAVLEVEPKGHFLSEVVIPVVLHLEGEVRVEPNFSALATLGRDGSRKELIASIARHVAGLTSPSDEAAALSLLKSRGISMLDRFGAGAPAGSWARYAMSDPAFNEARRPMTALCGSVLSPMVRGALIDRTAEWEAARPPSDRPILWLRPSLRQWGVGEAFEDVASAVARKSGSHDPLVLLCRPGEERMPPGGKRGRLAESGFSALVCVGGDQVPGALEVVLSPHRWALVLVHRAVTPGGLPVGNGFCSAAPTLVSSVAAMVLDLLTRAPKLTARRSAASEPFEAYPFLEAALQP